MYQQTYEIYDVLGCSCDSEWRYIGEVQAGSVVEALDVAVFTLIAPIPSQLVAQVKADVPVARPM